MSNVTDTTTPTSAKEDLAKALAQRPDREELVGRNILPSAWYSSFSDRCAMYGFWMSDAP